MFVKICFLFFFYLFFSLIEISILQTCTSLQDTVPNSVNEKCQPSCINRSGISPCTETTTSNCVCKSQFIRSNNLQCILPVNCPAPDSPCATSREDYTLNGLNPKCQRTCANPNGISPCTEPNVDNCICHSQYLRYVAGNTCLPPANCPATTVTDTTVSTVSTDSSGTTASTTTTQVPPFSSAICTGSYEIYSPNAFHIQCQGSCSYPAGEPNCPQGYYPGCVCLPSYVRNSNYACILGENCPATTTVATETTCSANQTYDSRAAHPDCRATCQNLSGSEFCTMNTYPGCVCQKWYVRNNRTSSQCIYILDC